MITLFILLDKFRPDSDAFIFTLKNNHGSNPTQFKIKDNSRAICCLYNCGPIFGNDEMHISNNCNNNSQSYIDFEGTYGCKDSSLFIGNRRSDGKIGFKVLDYEVYCIDYESRDDVYNICKHPDIIWEYIETKDISEESLKQVDDDTEIINDFDAILCEYSDIQSKISQFCLRTPSKFLSNTTIVNDKYDDYLREWLGNEYKWKLLFRASEHKYRAKSFHEYCDDVKGPTLVIIKSKDSCIFGGYTTKSWRGSETSSI